MAGSGVGVGAAEVKVRVPQEADAFGEFEKGGWRKAAAHYEASWAALTSLFVPHLLDHLEVGPATRVLDVCCGPGFLCAEAARRGATATGVDFAPEMVQRAKERHPGIELREGDAQELGFDDACFDVVAMSFGVPHLSRPEKAFTEAARVLRPGGRFGFTVWARPDLNPLAEIVDRAIGAHGELAVDLPEGPPFFRFADAVECRRTLEQAGFEGASLRFEAVSVHWRVPTAGFLFEAERMGGVRTAAVLARQGAESLRAIQDAVEEGVQKYRSDDGFAIPATAHVVSARVQQATGTRGGRSG